MADKKRAKAPTFTSPKGAFRFPKISEVDYGTKDYPAPEGKYSVELILKASDKTTQDFIAKLEPLHQQAAANAEVAFKALKAETRKKLGKVTLNALYTELLDKDTEEATGEISFKFGMKASGEYKNGPNAGKFWDSRPVVFDAGDKFTPPKVLIQGLRFETREDGLTTQDIHTKGKPNIWGGTIGKVSFEVGLDKDGEPGYFIPGTGIAGLKLGLTAIQVIDLVSSGQRNASSYGFDSEGGEDEGADESVIPPNEDGADF